MFRESPYGGLIVTQWVSGVSIDRQVLFRVVFVGDAAKTALAGDDPLLEGGGDEETEEMLGELEEEFKGKEKTRPLDLVDPIYKERVSPYGGKVGPKRGRRSAAVVEVEGKGILLPGNRPIPGGKDTVNIPCYPVTIVAAAPHNPNDAAPFTPTLTWGARMRLLGDMLFEHSPYMPLGDTTVLSGARSKPSNTEYLALMQGMAQGTRKFRKLTIYLPANGTKPYRLNGLEFGLNGKGVQILHPGKGNALNQKLAGIAGNPFGLTIQQAPLKKPVRQVALPVMTDLASGVKSVFDDEHRLLHVPLRGGPVSTRLELSAGKAVKLSVVVPALGGRERLARGVIQLIGGRTAKPVMRLVALPLSQATRNGTLTLSVRQSGARVPKTFTGSLVPWDKRSQAQELGPDRRAGLGSAAGPSAPTVGPGRRPGPLNFRKKGEYSQASLKGITPGLYGLRLDVPPETRLLIPLAIAGKETRGSVSLFTYHNRGDYLRGEELQAAVVLRSLDAEINSTGKLVLTHESGDSRALGAVELTCPRGGEKTAYVRLDTGKLRLGKHRLDLRASGLITRSLSFTLYPAQPKSTFVIHHWHDSFCNRIKAGNKFIVNCLMASDPSQYLATSEFERLTAQEHFPEAFRGWCETDALLPVPEATETYDPETEAVMAAMMRQGVRFAPHYSWDMNPYEADWNPKHTLPEDLERVHRLCLQVTQRYRDFGNFAGLHLNWYPTFWGYWEGNPATDGNQGKRKWILRQELQAIWQHKKLTVDAKVLKKMAPTKAAYRSTQAEALRDVMLSAAKYKTGSLARAYKAWTEGCRQLEAGLPTQSGLLPPREYSSDRADKQPGIYPDRPIYLSNVPTSWFNMMDYYPPVYFSTLPAAGVHAYTDYGWSPYQAMWCIDFQAAGLGDKPIWLTSMSNPGAILFRHAFLSVGRGADAVSFREEGDPATWQVVSEFLFRYGPFFRLLEPQSDVAILGSFRQMVSEGNLAGRWMGYTGGPYFDLFCKLWYARRPPAFLMDHEISPDRLKKYKAVFLINQRVPLAKPAMKALRAYVKGGGLIFKDEKTAPYYPGTTFALASEPPGKDRVKWDGSKYRNTKDAYFVGTLAGYENIAKSLDKLLEKLPPPRVTSETHNVLIDSLAGKDVLTVFAANDTHANPPIYHPWNFWHAMILPVESSISFAEPCVAYDLLAGGKELEPVKAADGRYHLPVSFNRGGARAYIVLRNKITGVRLKTAGSSKGGWLPVEAEVLAGGKVLRDPMPFELTVINDQGKIVETLYRGLGPGRRAAVRLPVAAKAGKWTIRVRELASGLSAEASISKSAGEKGGESRHGSRSHIKDTLRQGPVLVVRPDDVKAFFSTKAPVLPRQGAAAAAFKDPLVQVKVKPWNIHQGRKREFLILLDPAQLPVEQGERKAVLALAGKLKQALVKSGRKAEIRMVQADDVFSLPLRHKPTQTDRRILAEAESGKIIACAKSLQVKYAVRGEGIDFGYPTSGYAELAAAHRVYKETILLGMPATNRFLKDLHRAVGYRASKHFPGRGSALVQVVFDGFAPRHNVMSIQAPDNESLKKGVDAVLEILRRKPATHLEAAPRLALKSTSAKARKAEPGRMTGLPDYVHERLGKPIWVSRYLSNGDLLLGTGLERYNYFILGADGRIKRKWVGKYNLQISGNQRVFWLTHWYSVWDYVRYIVNVSPELKVNWMMPLPSYSRGFQNWGHPGRQSLADSTSDDLFLSGANRVSRVNPKGDVVWVYDDTDTCNDVTSFRFPRDLMIHSLSQDGKYLLVAAISIEPYSHFVSKFRRPQAMLINAANGRVLWRKNYLINHSVCSFVSHNRIAMADATPGRKRLALLDLRGKEIWSMARPQGTSAAILSRDGAWLIVRPEAERDRLHKILAPPRGVQAIRLADKSTREFPLDGSFSNWTYAKAHDRLLISLANGKLLCFKPDTSVLWQRQFAGPCYPSVAPDGKTILAGTPTGKLLWLDEKNGKIIRSLDLMDYNLIRDQKKYGAEYTRNPGGAPVMSPQPKLPDAVDKRCGKVIKFSRNLLTGQAGLKALTRGPFKGTASFRLKQRPGQTYVLSLYQKASGPAALKATVQADGKTVYQAVMPAANFWQERTLAWKAKSAAATLKLEFAGGKGGNGVSLKRPAVFAVTFPSQNILRQEKPGEKAGDDDDVLGGELDDDLAELGMTVKPPQLRYYMPNDVDLKARAKGAKPFRPAVWPDLPFDGKIVQEKNSWLGGPVAGKSTYATLTLTFEKPIGLAAFALYEDPAAPSRYTDTYAIFLRDAKRRRWVKAGHVRGNRNPFNLFTFTPVVADQIIYLWLKSGDGHARILEFEGYGADELF